MTEAISGQYNISNYNSLHLPFLIMDKLLESPLTIGSLELPHRLIQGPLAGYSCAPFRELFYQFTPPAYCVTEMISAHDLLFKHKLDSRYLYRSPQEKLLCYQLSGSDANTLAQAARRLSDLGADMIDINCGCPKSKIRKKGAGSALLENPHQLLNIVDAVRAATLTPLTIKIRIQGNQQDLLLAQKLEQAGADALIVHGRHWSEDYDTPCNFSQIAAIKQHVTIPVIANGDISNYQTLMNAVQQSACDGFMISRAGTGKPWLYQTLFSKQEIRFNWAQQKELFMQHLYGLAELENEYKAVLQSKSLIRYYSSYKLSSEQLANFYKSTDLKSINSLLTSENF